MSTLYFTDGRIINCPAFIIICEDGDIKKYKDSKSLIKYRPSGKNIIINAEGHRCYVQFCPRRGENLIEVDAAYKHISAVVNHKKQRRY